MSTNKDQTKRYNCMRLDRWYDLILRQRDSGFTDAAVHLAEVYAKEQTAEIEKRLALAETAADSLYATMMTLAKYHGDTMSGIRGEVVVKRTTAIDAINSMQKAFDARNQWKESKP